MTGVQWSFIHDCRGTRFADYINGITVISLKLLQDGEQPVGKPQLQAIPEH